MVFLNSLFNGLIQDGLIVFRTLTKTNHSVLQVSENKFFLLQIEIRGVIFPGSFHPQKEIEITSWKVRAYDLRVSGRRTSE